jgi:two-component system, NtrC family, nitrogen regulation sensor histidine kinase NtrY
MKNIKLRSKIYLSMISLVAISLIVMAFVTVLHYKSENDKYHFSRIERKEKRILKHISIILEENHIVEKDEAKAKIAKKINELREIHNIDIFIYNLDGELFASSGKEIVEKKMPADIFKELMVNTTYIETKKSTRMLGETSLYSYSFIDLNHEHILILYLPYLEENTIFKSELEQILLSYSQLFIIVLGVTIILAYLISTGITKSLKKISLLFNKAELKSDFVYKWESDDEIGALFKAYKETLNKLNEKADILIRNEKENAWKEMAKQIAHEIKNPLTPMRLEVQLLQRNSSKIEDEDLKNKLENFSKSLLLQIDTLSRIANEFSSFAKMPDQELSKHNLDEYLKYYLQIHNHSNVIFESGANDAYVEFDEKQFSRVLNNLIKNAKQSIPEGRIAKIQVGTFWEADYVVIKIIDNGEGIDESLKNKIFDPKFTTKDAGMGLGLSISKNIIESLSGELNFESELNKGTTFYIKLPKK